MANPPHIFNIFQDSPRPFTYFSTLFQDFSRPPTYFSTLFQDPPRPFAYFTFFDTVPRCGPSRFKALHLHIFFNTVSRHFKALHGFFFPKTQNTAPRPQMVCYFKIQQMTCSKLQTAYIGGLFYKNTPNHIPPTPPTARDTNTKHQAATRDRRCSAPLLRCDGRGGRGAAAWVCAVCAPSLDFLLFFLGAPLGKGTAFAVFTHLGGIVPASHR